MIVPTPYAAVNILLDDLLTNVWNILRDDLIGFYVDGSLALGDFNPATSDVDFVVATIGDLSEVKVSELAAMHKRITLSGRPMATELEGAYISLRALRHYNPADATHPNIERGPDELLRPKYHHSDWTIHRHIAREYGLTLFGPPAAALIDPISPDQLRAATADVLRSWWATPEAAESIRNGHPAYPAYVVQTMCRALYTLQHGAVVSKPAACRWALETQDAQWRPLIKRAMEWEIDLVSNPQTLGFVRHTTARFINP